MIKGEQPEELESADRFRYYLYLKLYTLVSAIILKYCGYDSFILNFPKIYENSTKIELKEEHYRKI